MKIVYWCACKVAVIVFIS